jgi:23S rRNA-/tRNA-specific pseudouridylate synthase
MKPRLLTRFGNVYYAFDKPTGMAIQRNVETVPDLTSWIDSQKSLPRGLQPVHRLDSGTSGVVMCGAGRKARAQMGEWLDSSTKTYLALVAGTPPKEQGSFQKQLFDRRRGRYLPSCTLYRVQEQLHGFTLLELELVTGRRHQVRRHLADANLPIVGDDRYGPKRPVRIPHFPNRLWLHACKVELGDRVIEAPLAIELQEHLRMIRSKE